MTLFAAQNQNEGFVARVERQESRQSLIGQDGAPRRIVVKNWDGRSVIREITAEDIDRIGQACMDSINGN